MTRPSTVHGYVRPHNLQCPYNRNHSHVTSELANELFKMILLESCIAGIKAQVFGQAGGLMFLPASSEGKQAGLLAWTFLLTIVAECPRFIYCLPAYNRLGATSSFNVICISSTPVVSYS